MSNPLYSRWERLRKVASARNCTEVLRLMDEVEYMLKTEDVTRNERFTSYLPPRDYSTHDAQCQVTRLGAIHCCTCEAERIRRQQQIVNAAKAGDLEFRATLGTMEACAFDRHYNHGKWRFADANNT